MDAETSRRFGFGQHSAVPKSVVARAKRVLMDEIRDAQGGEASIAAPRPRRSAGTKSLLVEDVGDLGIDVIVEELVDELDDDVGGVFTCCADDLGFNVVSVSVLPPLKRTWILVIPSAGSLISVASSMM